MTNEFFNGVTEACLSYTTFLPVFGSVNVPIIYCLLVFSEVVNCAGAGPYMAAPRVAVTTERLIHCECACESSS